MTVDLKPQILQILQILTDPNAQSDLKELATSELLAVLGTASTHPHPTRLVLEIRSGTGGMEAELFAFQLLRMYERYAQRRGWSFTILESSLTPLGGVKEAIAEIAGPDAYQKLCFEAGVHRVQRVPKTEKAGRLHTSAASVVVLPEIEEKDLIIRPEDLRVDVYRSRGHGGQGVNTTDSAVRITHLASGIVVSCQDERSQLKNRAKAMRVLRARLAQKQAEENQEGRTQLRRSFIGSGDRSEKIRTYNFPQDRITDHRIKLSIHGIERVMDGELDQLSSALSKADTIELLKTRYEEVVGEPLDVTLIPPG